ncbi:hypothetical protein T4B_11141 [Trichinella pseudospiralis]|uniref:Uncharacterized protein n=1 Tax=Trichinella pseudospiralis TaxID=6337 RepID=A0A0V1GQQ5_TRIPS|nr:hypothetical protein T4B_11141 [Trichinella pseudospiralis]
MPLKMQVPFLIDVILPIASHKISISITSNDGSNTTTIGIPFYYPLSYESLRLPFVIASLNVERLYIGMLNKLINQEIHTTVTNIPLEK